MVCPLYPYDPYDDSILNAKKKNIYKMLTIFVNNVRFIAEGLLTAYSQYAGQRDRKFNI